MVPSRDDHSRSNTKAFCFSIPDKVYCCCNHHHEITLLQLPNGVRALRNHSHVTTFPNYLFMGVEALVMNVGLLLYAQVVQPTRNRSILLSYVSQIDTFQAR